MDDKETKKEQESTPQMTSIQKISIQGLWQTHRVEWDLQPDVNVLVGINGSGKSTLLHVVERLFWEYQEASKRRVTTQLATFRLAGLPDSLFKTDLCDAIRVEGDEGLSLATTSFEAELMFHAPRYFELNIQKINTFENPFVEKEAIQKLSNNYVKTNLDWALWQLEKDYKGYKSKILNRFRKEKNERVFDGDNTFVEIINEHFEETKKKLYVDDESTLSFVSGEVYLTPYHLSSGEKQLLIILLNVLMQDSEPFILLMDEPEISLHLKWQTSLIDNIRRLNPNCQIILATHAPGIIKKGWVDKMFDSKEIIKKIKTDTKEKE